MIDISNGKNHFINTAKIDGIIKSICNNNNNELYNYGNVKGDKTLREQIANFYNCQYETQITSHNVIITNGSQQSLSYILDYLGLNYYSTINICTPTYYGIIELANLKKFRLNNYSTIKETKQIKEVIYITPYNNNPDGRNITQKEYAVLKQLSEHNIIIEDDPYSLFSFNKKNNPPLFTKLKNVIYLGTFSKIISPSINIGYIICKDIDIINSLYAIKKANCLHTSVFMQKVVSEYIKEDFLQEIKQKSQLLRINYETIKMLVKKYFNNEVFVSNINGGYFTVLTFPQNVDALKTKVNFCFCTLEDFYIDKSLGKNQIRINLSLNINFDLIFSNLSVEYYKNSKKHS